MVVSEIGEQWSPYTEPASVAPRAGIRMDAPSALPSQIMDTIGIKIPNVPHAVPIEKDRKDATTKMIAGKILKDTLEPATRPLTNSPVPIISRQTPLKDQARERIITAETISFTPAVIPPMKSRKVTSFLGM